MKIGSPSQTPTHVPSLFGGTVALTTIDTTAAQVADNFDQHNPKQLLIPFSYNDKKHNAKLQSTEKEYKDTMLNLEDTLKFIDLYNKNIQTTTNLLTLSENDKEIIINKCDELLTYLQPIANKVAHIPNTKIMYDKVVNKIQGVKNQATRKDIDSFYQNCNYIINTYNKDFYKHEDEKKVEGFLTKVIKAQAESEKQGGEMIKENYIHLVKSFATLNYSIHKADFSNTSLNELLDIGGANNSNRDNTTADIADRVTNSNNTNKSDIEDLWKRFINLNYILINNKTSDSITPESFNSALDYFKATGDVLIKADARLHAQKNFIEIQIKKIKDEAIASGYISDFDNASNRSTIKNKAGLFAGLKSLTNKGTTAEQYNNSLLDLYTYNDALLRLDKELKATEKELHPKQQNSLQKIPAFHQFIGG